MIQEVKENNVIILFIILLWAFPVFSQTLEATWNPSEGATGYTLYWGTESRNYTDLKVTSNTQIQIPLLRFERENIYYFVVTSFNDYGESSFGDEVSFFIITGVEESVLDFQDCDEIRTYNIKGQEVKSDRSQLPSGFYVRQCSIGGKIILIKSEILVK